MKSRPAKKHLLIDWSKTLSHSLFWDNSNSIESTSARRWLFENNTNLVSPWMKGKYSAEQICNLIATDTALDPKKLVNELIASCQRMTLCSQEIYPLIAKIKKRNYSVVIATDNMDTFTRFTIPALKLANYFDDFLVSAELKILKETLSRDNEPLFFTKYIKKNRCDFHDLILLDDSITNLSAHAKIGMKIVQIDSPSELILSLRGYAKG